ncbi:MAG: hypothetical protein SAL07_09770 [Oscillatoria sp. PMC 1051.18]|nr:hypothetical protein [Oscillatoria sp. PMC 1050.18]MEC5030190.1 hypothetical protein [Oscillatoria sp. PMC 1051.18]
MNLWLSLIIFLPIFFFAYVIAAPFLGQKVMGKDGGEMVPFFAVGFVSSLALHYLIIHYLGLFLSLLKYGFALFLLPLFIFLGYLVTWRWRKKQAGYLLLTLGSLGNRQLLLLASLVQVAIAACLTWGIIVRSIGEVSLNYYQLVFHLSPAIFLGFLAIFCFAVSQARLELRERGICPGFYTIKWEQIADYQWEGENECLLKVYFQAGFPLVKNWSWRIRDKHREAVEIIISEFTSFYKSEKTSDISTKSLRSN